MKKLFAILLMIILLSSCTSTPKINDPESIKKYLTSNTFSVHTSGNATIFFEEGGKFRYTDNDNSSNSYTSEYTIGGVDFGYRVVINIAGSEGWYLTDKGAVFHNSDCFVRD